MAVCLPFLTSHFKWVHVLVLTGGLRMLVTWPGSSRPSHSSFYNLIERAIQLLLAPFRRFVPFLGGDRSPAVLRVLDPVPSLI